MNEPPSSVSSCVTTRPTGSRTTTIAPATGAPVRASTTRPAKAPVSVPRIRCISSVTEATSPRPMTKYDVKENVWPGASAAGGLVV
jgi:hypothetical protein